MKNRIKIGLMLGTAGALGWTPAYAQAPAEAQIAPALPQAVAPAQAESPDPASMVGIGDIVVNAQHRAGTVQQDRKRVVKGKSVSVRVELGGCRYLKTNIKPQCIHRNT